MKRPTKFIKVKVERTIPASPSEVYSAWLNPKVKGSNWSVADKLILNPKVNGFFYWHIFKTPHYGRFTKMERGRRIQYTWMSPYTHGEESTVTLTFKKKGKDTQMTLVHSGLPDTRAARSHEGGWNQFADNFSKHFKKKKK